MWRKLTILGVMSIHPFVVNITSASLSSSLPIYASTPVFGFPPKSFSQLTYLVAVNILTLGASNIWWVPLANTYGRRPVILSSLLVLVFSSMWAGLATSFSSLLAARIFMGIGGAPADAVSPEVVGEIFYVHQRGRAMVSCLSPFTPGRLRTDETLRPSIPCFCPLVQQWADSLVVTSLATWGCHGSIG
jgi:MFS family permease